MTTRSRGRFKPGTSGNPAGRPPGRPDRRTALREALSADLPEIVQRVVAEAKAGDMRAAELVLSRCLPALRPQSLPVSFPINAAGNLADAGRDVLAAVAAGEIDPATGKGLLDALAGLTRIVEITEIEARLRALEENR